MTCPSHGQTLTRLPGTNFLACPVKSCSWAVVNPVKQLPNEKDGNANHSALVRQVGDYLDLIGAWRMKVLGGIGQRSGIPDILACHKGRFLAIECKTGKGSLSPAQVRERMDLESAGAAYILCRSLDDLIAWAEAGEVSCS